MRLVDTLSIYANPNPLLVSRQAVFPGLVQMPDGDIVAVFSIGQAFDSADQRAVVSRSCDNGRTWSDPERLCSHECQPEESESYKPLLLADGRLLATGYTFIRPGPLVPIVDPETFEVLPMRNKVAFSHDGGRTWTNPAAFSVDGAQLELSGPCIQLSSGRLLGAAAPFHLSKTGHAGWIIASDDQGANWFKLSEFFRAENGAISPWECRLCETVAGEVGVIFWAYDNASGTNLNNHIALSCDGGETFGPAVDTGIRGQASNLISLGPDRLLTIHAHREAPVGLVVRKLEVREGRVVIEQEFDLFADDRMGSDSADISRQFGSLKFGQPSLLRLLDGQILATCWRLENSQHVIKGYILAD